MFEHIGTLEKLKGTTAVQLLEMSPLIAQCQYGKENIL